jgi:hypothetical protein
MSGTGSWGQPLTWPQARGAPAVRLSAAAPARTLIARDLGLGGLDSLEAALTLTPWRDGVEIAGRVLARATQICGISLEPFDVEIDEPLLIRVVPAGSPNAPLPPDGEVIIDPDAEDPPDEAAGEAIDVTAYVIEALALALDPFPRKPGAVFEPPGPTAEMSPFAALARLSRPPS